MIRAVVVSAALAIGIVFAARAPGAVPEAPARMRVEPSAQATLAGARAYLGGVALRAIRSFDLAGSRTRFPPDGAAGARAQTETFHFRFLLPDSFQRIHDTVVNTIERGAFWQKPSYGPAMAAKAGPNTKYDFAYWTTVLLLQPALRDVSVTDLGVQQVGSVRGRVLRYVGDHFDVRVAIDERSHRPLAVATKSSLVVGGTSGPSSNVSVLGDYRVAGGIKVPFTIEETIGGFLSRIVLERVEVNSLKADDFKER